MKPNFFLAALFTTLYPLFVSAQPWDFAKRYSAAVGSTLTNSAVATAPDGSTYLVGSIRGTATFDGISATTPAGVTQYYLLKMNSSSQAVWVQTFDQKAYHVTTDPQGNVFIAGAIAAGTPASDSLTYVAKYDASGQLLADFESSGLGKSWARVVRTDSAGNCYVTGWKTGGVTFGAITPPNQGSRDNFLIKLSPDLAQVNWAVNTGSSNNLDEVYDLELDDNGGIFTSGNYSQSFNLGCFCYNGSFFTEKRSTTNGALVWQKLYSGGSGTTTQQVVSLSSDGQSLYTAASFKNTTTINPGVTLTAQSGTDDYHLFATDLNAATGTVQWAKKISFTGDSYITGMAQADDNLHLHGYFKSNTLIGSVLLEPLGTFDAFYAQVTPATGDVASAEKFTGNSTDQGFGITSGDGRLAVSGNAASSTLTIGTFNLTGNSSSIYVAGKTYDVPLNISLTNVTNASCPGVADGNATVSVQGGTAPYTYLWSNGQTTATAIDLAAGTYTVTVTDNAGAQISTTATITEPAALTVGFTSNVNTLTASFSNTSANATSYSWNFGDGQISTDANPVHTYANCGTYTVTLTATNLCGTNTSSTTVTIGNGNPTASFTNSVNSLTATFSNTSTNATSYSWNFGDGQTSTLPNPSHTYANCGTYTVTMTATNLCGDDVSTAAITIGIGDPVANFSSSVDSLTATFSNTSTNATSYLWNFGDGQTSPEVTPMHTYADPGTYTVSLIATNICGSDTFSQTVVISPVGVAPIADFEADKMVVCVGDTVRFTNLTSNGESFVWWFPGAEPMNSTETNPVVVYVMPGEYVVALTASNPFGDDHEMKEEFIIVLPLPIADFGVDTNGLAVVLTDNSQHADSYEWDFGDGQTLNNSADTIEHTYSMPGIYTIRLTIQNECGVSILEKTVAVGTVSTEIATWLDTFRLFPNPNNGAFTLEMSGEVEGDVEFSLFSLDGRLLRRETATFGNGTLLQNFDYGDLPPALYLLRIRAGEKTAFEKVMIQR